MTKPISPREAAAARSEAEHATAHESGTSPARDRWERALQRYLQISMRQSTRTGPSAPAAPADTEPAAAPPAPKTSALQSLLRAFSSIDLGGIFPRRQQPPRGRG